MTVATKAPYDLADTLQLLAVRQVALPVPVPPKPTVAGLKHELGLAAEELGRNAQDLASVSRRTWGGVKDSFLQKTSARIHSAELLTSRAARWFTKRASFVGGVVGVVVGLACESFPLTLLIWGGATALGASVTPAAALIDHAATREENRAKATMVDAAEVAPLLERFRGAKGLDKLQIAMSLDALRIALDEQEVLAPEARIALLEVGEAAKDLQATHGKRALLLRRAASLIVEPIGARSLDTARSVLGELPESDRPVAAQALLELVFADRARVVKARYADRNVLHEFLYQAAKGVAASAAPPHNIASPT